MYFKQLLTLVVALICGAASNELQQQEVFSFVDDRSEKEHPNGRRIRSRTQTTKSQKSKTNWNRKYRIRDQLKANKDTLQNLANAAKDSKVRIVNGADVPSNSDYPWFAHIMKPSGNSGDGYCGGTLIAPDIVLTAAHCGNIVQVGGIVRLGSINRDYGGQVRKIKNRVVHPYYDFSKDKRYDFMIVKIYKTKGIKPAQLNPYDNVPSENGQQVRIVGFGATNLAGTDYPNTLKHANVNTLSRQQCDNMYAQYGMDDTAHLCAGTSIGIDSCYGDSGGPIFMYDRNGDPLLLGVTSWGATPEYGCGDPNHWGVYARVSGAHDWIRSTMCKMTGTKFCKTTNLLSAFRTYGYTYSVYVKYGTMPQFTSVKLYDAKNNMLLWRLGGSCFAFGCASNANKSFPVKLAKKKKYKLSLYDMSGGFCCSNTKGYGYVEIRAKSESDGKVTVLKKVSGKGTSKNIWFSVPGII